ncbi:uncharacterized protein LOC114249196 [Bombyx mandarina]|uniref:Uncharacterized protein LOC114249196 n=1 Tax=Bombyx mandarina TaxID=7092 RepID=A0A6J2K924_BOMMA|nr:uncharacterized protein LOC114249196 [Bombyx mandarina]
MEYTCCNKVVNTRDNKKSTLVCTVCRNYYHIGCVLPAKKDWTPDSEFKSTWICLNCATRSRTVNDDTPVRGNVRPRAPDTSNVTMRPLRTGSREREGPELQVVPLEQVRSIVRAEVQEAVACFRDTILELKSEISTLRDSVSFISDKYEAISKRFLEFNDHLKVIPTLKNELSILDSRMQSIDSQFNLKEQWSRRSNIEILGIPERKGENLIELVSKIAEKAGFALNPQIDVDFVTRVAPMDRSSSRSKPVILRFVSRYRKDDMLAKLRRLKELKSSDIGFPHDSSRLYFNDHLTKNNKLLLKNVKNLAKEKFYKYVWVRNCTILVRKNDVSPPVVIASQDDLKKII